MAFHAKAGAKEWGRAIFNKLLSPIRLLVFVEVASIASLTYYLLYNIVNIIVNIKLCKTNFSWERSSIALRSVRFGVRSRKLSNDGQSLDGWPKMYYLELLRAVEDTISRRSRLHLQSLALTHKHWAHVVDYGPFSLCVIYKEGLCCSSGHINRLMISRAESCGVRDRTKE
jgi:hypothetical protein